MDFTFNPELVMQYGAMGIMLVWFMFRAEKKLDRVTEAIDNVAEILLKK